MAIPQQKPSFAPPERSDARISALDSTRYTLDMLENLRKIASGQGQVVLAHLLELAQVEAKLVLREHQRQATRFPG